MQSIATQIANGDLTHEFDQSASPDSVYGAMAAMSSNLKNLIGQIRQTIHTQGETSKQLAAVTEETNANIQDQHLSTTQSAGGNAMK